MRFGADGLEPFWWPVAQAELLDFRDALHERLAALALGAEESDGRLLRIAMPGLLYRAMALFEAAAAMERAAASGIEIETPRGGLSLGPLLRGEAPSDDALDPRNRLRRPFAPEPRWRAMARVLHNHWLGASIPRRRLFEIDPRRGVVTVALNPSIERMAAAEEGPVVYCHPREWFSTTAPDDGPACSAGFCDAVLDAVTRAALRADLIMPDLALVHLRGYVESITALARYNLERLLAKPRRLPRRLWMVSGVTQWARVLSTAVQLNGGEATGFEHGTGESWSARCGDTQFEFDVLDRFLCYSEETARRSRAQQDAGLRARAANSLCLPLPSGESRQEASGRSALPARPRVMLVSSLYRQDRFMRYKPALADPVAVDWQARLFGQLKRWGYEPQFRPHPDQREGLPDFTEALAVPKATGGFAAALNEADILLFDLPLTSAWRDGLCAGKPVVLVDFGQSSLSPDALPLAERRMAILPAGFDEENRALVDWEALRAALESAPSLDDAEFVTRYFGHA